jgi:hypothetical protein
VKTKIIAVCVVDRTKETKDDALLGEYFYTCECSVYTFYGSIKSVTNITSTTQWISGHASLANEIMVLSPMF